MHNIRLHMNIFYLRPDRDDIMYPYEVKTKIKKILMLIQIMLLKICLTFLWMTVMKK